MENNGDDFVASNIVRNREDYEASIIGRKRGVSITSNMGKY
jgi:hypothetical protein